jgi:hypothetical protein
MIFTLSFEIMINECEYYIVCVFITQSHEKFTNERVRGSKKKNNFYFKTSREEKVK